MKYRIFGSLLLCANTVLAGTPAIIPLPQTLQVRAGTFTLCPTQPSAGLPAQATTRILADSNSLPTAQYLAMLLGKSTGCQFQVVSNAGTAAVKNTIVLTTSNAVTTLGAEGYELTVAPDSVLIRAPAAAGVFYGVQSLLQLLPPQIYAQQPVTNVAWTAPCAYVKDQPRFSWRGWMMDTSRHFYNKDEVKQGLDIMAMHKLNTFHWHLTDDQGWRIQILAYPLLTSTGAFRHGLGANGYNFNPRAGTQGSYNTNNGSYGGFYTQDDIRDVVAYAAQRYITILPEIEMPCHSTAALSSYPQFGCGNAATRYNQTNINYGFDLFSLDTLTNPTNNSYTLIYEVLTEAMSLFPGKYIHCGGDEVVSSGDTQWLTYGPDVAQMSALGFTNTGTAAIMQYQNWFSTNVANFLTTNGHTMVGWKDIEDYAVVTNAVCMDWQTGSSSQAVNAATNGQQVVMTPDATCYFNYYMDTNLNYEPYFIVGSMLSTITLSNMYVWEPVPTNLPSQYNSNILGAEAVEFAEFIPSMKNVEFKALPRLSAMAELTWTAAAQKNYTNFYSRLQTQQQRFTQMGVNYDHTNSTLIGTWSAPISTTTNGTTLTYDITTLVTNSGEIDINLIYTSGADGIWISSVALLQNGVPVDTNVYTGFAGASETQPPTYVLYLPSYKPGATYTLKALATGRGGTDSAGNVFLVNWN